MTEASPSPMPSSATLENLPLLVHELLCEYLGISDSNRQSLYAFSLTSRRCCAATARERFGRICFAVKDYHQLQQVLARADDVLSIDGRNRYVRRIKIKGRMKYRTENAKPAGTSYPGSSGDGEGGSPQLQSQGSLAGFEPAMTEPYNTQNHQEWQPLASFLSKSPGLKHFIWASANQVPRCILDVLHNQLPDTRLHVENFSLRSLYQKRTELRDIDLDEYALASSPSLTSIRAVSVYFDSLGYVDYNEEAVLQMVMQSAPNLQSVCMSYQVSGNYPQPLDIMQTPRPPWRGFFEGKDLKTHKLPGRLTELSLVGARPIRLEKLQEWSLCTDFSKLRILKLDHMEKETLSALAQMVFDGALVRLHTFMLDVGYTPEYREVVADNVLMILPPLADLTIEGVIDKAILSAIFYRHGESLTRLQIDCPIADEDIKTLRKACPNVRDLELTINRRQGDEQEVRLYQTLGSIPRLEKLALLLKCEVAEMHPHSCVPLLNPEPDASAQQLPSQEAIIKEQKIQRMRSALISSAVDAKLAESIFHIIIAANRAARPDVVPSFQCLKLRCYPYDRRHYFKLLQELIGGSWMCERKWADAHSSEVVVREIRHRRKMMTSYLREKINENFKWCDDGELYRLAWEAVWPEAKEKACWADEWYSFPLWKET